MWPYAPGQTIANGVIARLGAGCYVELVSGFGNTEDELIDVGESSTTQPVDLDLTGIAGFYTEPACGTWTMVA
jgi:hypothetical protein